MRFGPRHLASFGQWQGTCAPRYPPARSGGLMPISLTNPVAGDVGWAYEGWVAGGMVGPPPELLR